MDARPESQEEFGSVKAAISLRKERIRGIAEGLPLENQEFHQAKVGIGRSNVSKRFAEEEKARLESELYIARNAAKELAQKIKVSNAKAVAQKLELQSLRSSGERKEAHTLLGLEIILGQYSEVLRELNHVKQELSRFKLDVASASEAKAKAEKEIDASNSQARMCSSYIEELKKEREEAIEEQVLVELARIEAEREFRDIEAQRVAEAAKFATTMDKTRRRIKNLQKEIDSVKDLEKKLAITTSDVNALQSEMELLRAMERNFQKNQIKRNAEELQNLSLLQAAEVELEAARKELASIKNEGFQFMASMDLVRGELMHIAEESDQLKKSEKKADSAIQYLNSQLLKAKSKKKSTLMADERTKAIIFNLSTAMQQLQTDIVEAKKESELVTEETKPIIMETEEINLGIDSMEARLQSVMEELDAAKASETVALARLRTVSERRMRARAHSSQYSSTITISMFEYEYLRRRAEAAEEVADKKVVAAQAWTEAIEAREKKISLTAEIMQKEIMKLRVVEERELNNKGCSENEAKALDMQFGVASPRSLRGENGVPGESRRFKIRRSSVSSGRRCNITRSPSSTVKKRRKVMIDLVRFLRGQRIRKLKCKIL